MVKHIQTIRQIVLSVFDYFVGLVLISLRSCIGIFSLTCRTKFTPFVFLSFCKMHLLYNMELCCRKRELFFVSEIKRKLMFVLTILTSQLYLSRLLEKHNSLQLSFFPVLLDFHNFSWSSKFWSSISDIENTEAAVRRWSKK